MASVIYPTDVTIKNLTSNVTVTVLGITKPFKVPVPDACKDQGLKCPLAPNMMAKFTTTLTLPSKIPITGVSVLCFDAVVCMQVCTCLCMWGGGVMWCELSLSVCHVLAVQITAIIEWKLVDSSNVEQVCVQFSVKVVSG